MYVHRHKFTGRVALFLRDDQVGKVTSEPPEDYEDVYMGDHDPEAYMYGTLGELSPEPDKAVGVPYLIDDMTHPPAQCPPGVLAPMDTTMNTADIEHKDGTRTWRCMPVARPTNMADAMGQILDEDKLPDQAAISAATMRKAIGRAQGKSRKPGSIVPRTG